MFLSLSIGVNNITKSVAIINRPFNYRALGSIIGLTKKYVDVVYIIQDSNDESISELATLIGAKIINLSNNGHTPVFDSILKSEKDVGALVTLYGDGTHDPSNIPHLMDPIVKGEFDVVVGSAIENDPKVNSLMFLTKGKSTPRVFKNNQFGFAAISYKCLDTVKSSNGGDILRQILADSKNKSLKVKHLHFGIDQKFGLLNQYKIGVVVPAYNEELLIEETIKGIPKYVDRIYLIDDCSTDRTPHIIKEMTDHRIVSVRHDKNKGVGGTIVTGYKLSLDDEMDIVAVMAGDNQMDPEQLPRLLTPILEGRADYTKGNRLISKDFRQGMSKWRSLGNGLLTMITKIGSGCWHIMDPQNGYTAISRQTLEVLNLDSIYPYYGYCNDMLVKLNTFNMRIEDVVMPSRYGRETSKIKYSKYILKVAPMLFNGFLWRLKTKYVVLDFHPLVFFYIASMVLLPVGALFSTYILIEKIYHNPVSQNYPLLAVFITLIGLQFLLFAMLFDMQADKSRSGTL